MDTPEQIQEHSFSAEKTGAVNLHIELGEHSNLKSYDKSSEINLNNSFWYPQVTERIRSYSPAMLTIDGLHPLSLYLGFSGYTTDQKRRVWELLPGRPSKLNEKGEVMVIAGDLGFSEVPVSVPEDFPEDTQKLIAHTVHAQDESQKENIKTKEAKVRMLHTGSAGLLFAAITAGYYHNNLNKNFTRRDVLRFGARTTFAATIGATIGLGMREAPEEIMSFTNNQKIADIAEYIASKQSVFMQDTWLDGRTALMIAKAIQAGSEGTVPSGSEASVVMGGNHGYASYELAHSREKRINAIGKYYESLKKFMDDVHEKFPDVKTNDNLGYLKMLLMRAERLIVTDNRDIDRVSNTHAEDFFNKHVTYDGFFESQEVREAIERVDQKPNDQVKVF